MGWEPAWPGTTSAGSGSGHRGEADHEEHTGDEEQPDEYEDGDGGSRSHPRDGTAVSDLLFLTRKTCALCSEAYPVVTEAARRREHTIEVVDVDEAALADRFGDRVPVVLRDGVEVLSGRFEPGEVRRALR